MGVTVKNTSNRVTLAALATAILALVVGTAGAGYSAAKINGNQILKGSIKGKAIKKETIKSKHIKNGEVRAEDLAPGAAVPAAYNAHDAGNIQVGDLPTFVTVATLPALPAGEYAIYGKATVEPDPLPGSDTAQAICALFVNGAEVDRSLIQVGENAAALPVTLRGTLPVQAAQAVPANAVVTLGCAKGGANVQVRAYQRQLTAVAVNLP
jgi:hypothetical protein